MFFGTNLHTSFPAQGIEFSPGRCEVWVRPEGQPPVSAFRGGGKGSTHPRFVQFVSPKMLFWKQHHLDHIFLYIGPKISWSNKKSVLDHFWMNPSVEETHMYFSWIFDWSFSRRHPSISSASWLCLLPFRGSQWPGKLIGSVYLVLVFWRKAVVKLWNNKHVWWWWWWWWWSLAVDDDGEVCLVWGFWWSMLLLIEMIITCPRLDVNVTFLLSSRFQVLLLPTDVAISCKWCSYQRAFKSIVLFAGYCIRRFVMTRVRGSWMMKFQVSPVTKFRKPFVFLIANAY